MRGRCQRTGGGPTTEPLNRSVRSTAADQARTEATVEVVVRRVLSWLWRQLTDAVPIPVAGETILTACMACDQRTLFRRPGSAVIECSCGAVYSVDDYVHLVRAEDEHDQRAW